jgi:hypothetical protein
MEVKIDNKELKIIEFEKRESFISLKVSLDGKLYEGLLLCYENEMRKWNEE